MNICTTCGRSGRLERHHVGRRKNSTVTTPLCVLCHRYCTIADVYERRWRDGEPAIARLWAGVMDVWNRFAMCNGFVITANDVLNDAEYRGLWKYHASSAIADYVEQKSVNTLLAQCREIARLVGEVINYES